MILTAHGTGTRVTHERSRLVASELFSKIQTLESCLGATCLVSEVLNLLCG